MRLFEGPHRNGPDSTFILSDDPEYDKLNHRLRGGMVRFARTARTDGAPPRRPARRLALDLPVSSVVPEFPQVGEGNSGRRPTG